MAGDVDDSTINIVVVIIIIIIINVLAFKCKQKTVLGIVNILYNARQPGEERSSGMTTF